MHYKNGTPAKVGDFVLAKNHNGIPFTGVVVATQAQSDTCNLTVAPVNPLSSFTLTAKECLRADEALEPPAPALVDVSN